MHGRGGVHGWGGACVAGETVTAADGTHPTGMHSCYRRLRLLAVFLLDEKSVTLSMKISKIVRFFVRQKRSISKTT